MSDETKKVDRARDDRILQQQRESVKPKPKEGDFDKVLEKSQMASKLMPQQQIQAKTITEEAVREAAKRDDRGQDERKRDDGEQKDNRDTHQKGERGESSVSQQKVVAKGRLKDGGQGSGGHEGREGGFGAQMGRRSLASVLSKSSAKSLPVDLQGKFAAKLAETLKGADQQNVLTQQVLNKIVQYVKIGINRKGDKEIQIELHERIFRGLKLAVSFHEGKVSVKFRASDKKGREVLQKNSDAIRAALNKKGIDVDEILIS